MRYRLRSLMILMAVGPPILGLVVPAVAGFVWYVYHDLRAQIIALIVGILCLPLAYAILSDTWRRVLRLPRA